MITNTGHIDVEEGSALQINKMRLRLENPDKPLGHFEGMI